MKRVLLLFVFILLTQTFATKRTLTLLEVKRGPGINSDQVTFLQNKADSILKTLNLFDIRPKTAMTVLIDKLGGCKKDDCYNSAAKEVGIHLLASIGLFKQRTEYVATLYVFDTELGEQVMEYSEKLPGEIDLVSDSWVEKFLMQLEPMAVAAEEVAVKEANADEAAQKATVIMEDELSGKLTKDKSPYLLIRNVVVPANAVLEIDPGVTLLVSGDYVSIVVYGQLMVKGTRENPVIIKSAKKDAKQWDWDRIYIRGNTRSYLNYCIISNSNYGVCVDNGNVTLSECRFIRNSISCVYAYMSEVSISNTEIGSGHIIGINVDRGSSVLVDSGSIRNSNRAVVCQSFGKLEMSRTRIENNDIGVVADQNGLVELKDIHVSDNRIGVLSQLPIKEGKLFMVKGNDENMKIMDKSEAQKFFVKPERVASVRAKEKEFNDTTGFKSGFSSAPSRGESLAARLGLLGQVSLGMTYRQVNDLNNSVHSGVADSALPHQATYVPGLRPELQLYMQSKVGDRSSDFTLNGYGNYNGNRTQGAGGETHLENLNAYRSLQKIEVVNLTTNIPNHEFILGDFTESGSELSIASRQIRGLKWQGKLNAKPNRALDVEVLGGQSVIPYERGLKPDMLDSNTTPVRQEWLGMGSVKTKAGPDLVVGAHYIYSRQVDDPLLVPGIHFDSTELYGADPKLASMSGGFTAQMIFNDKYSAYAEIDAGYADTLSVDVDSSDVNPINYSKDTTIHHGIGLDNLAALAGLDYSLRGFTGNIEYLRAQNQFYSGGNPSIKPVVGNFQKAQFTGGKTFDLNLLNGKIKAVDLSTAFDWEAVGSEENGIKADTLGKDRLVLIDTSESGRKAEFEAYGNQDFRYQPMENKIKGALGLKIPVADFSFEPAFTYYYETKPLLKIDVKSQTVTATVDGVDKTVTATEYADAESRVQVGTVLVFAPPFANKTISNMRYKLEYERIFIDDKNDFDVDSIKWSKNDGYQQRVKGSFAAKFLKKRLANKFDAGYRYKEKKERTEKKTTINVLDKLSVDVIPRKIILNIQGYFSKTTTDYIESETDASINELQKLYGGESEIKWSITPMFSVSARGGYENGFDDSESGSENYDTVYGGFTLNLLF